MANLPSIATRDRAPGAIAPGVGSYLIGLGLAAILTGTSFWAAGTHLIWSQAVPIALAVLDHAFLSPYDGVYGQFMLVIIGAIYAAGILWLRRLATFESPQRLLGTAGAASVPAAEPEAVTAWRGGAA